MSDKLEAYLEEISHFLSGRAEREEILSEIRSHIREKAAEGPGEFTDAAIDRAIAAYGPPRRVAERYAEDRPIIAPAFKRYLFRYTSLLFAVHAAFTVIGVVTGKTFVVFPFLYMPVLSVFDAVMYLPTAFLADLGLVAARPLLRHPERQGRQAPLAEDRRRPRRGQAAEEGLLGPRRYGRRGRRHAGRHRLRPLHLRPPPDDLPVLDARRRSASPC